MATLQELLRQNQSISATPSGLGSTDPTRATGIFPSIANTISTGIDRVGDFFDPAVTRIGDILTSAGESLYSPGITPTGIDNFVPRDRTKPTQTSTGTSNTPGDVFYNSGNADPSLGGTGLNTSGSNLTAYQFRDLYTPQETAAEKAYRIAQEAENARLAGLATEETEDARRTRITADFQSEIDALNAVYARQRQEAIQAGLGNLGTQGAIQARRGLLGSSFGEAATKGAEAENQQMLNKVDEAKNLSMSAVYSKIRAEISQSKKDKAEAIKASKDAHLAYLKAIPEKQKATASNAIKAMISGGAKPTDEDITNIATQIGIDPAMFKSEYETAKSEQEAKAAKAKQESDKVASELATELSTRVKNNADINKPFAAGGYIYQYTRDGFKQVGEARSTSGESDSGLSANEVTQAVNKLIGTSEFKELDKKQKQDAIRMLGGSPSDFSY